MNNRGMRTVAIYMVIILLAMTFVRLGEPVEQENVTVADIANYTQLMQDVEAGKIASVAITTYENTQTVDGELKDGSVFSGVVIPRENAETTLAVMQEYGVEIDQKETPAPSPWVTILSSLLPILLMVGLFIFIMQQSQGGGGKVMQFSKSKARVTIDEKNKVTFVFVENALCATAIYNADEWSLH